MNDHRLDFLAIVDDDGILKGILTRSDLLRAVEIAALADPDVDLPLIEVMASDPIVLTMDETLTSAVTTMREHGLKRLPVVQCSERREIVGYLRIEKIMDYVVKRMMAAKRTATRIGL
jgi:signal-transduction protein with cAMP-binding, CBS, and nucleotidyltransferase domain